MLLAINTIESNIRISFRGLRPCRYIKKSPKFEKIDYYAFKNLELFIDNKPRKPKNKDQIHKNLNLLKVINPNFKGLLSKRATMEYDFKKGLVKKRREEYLESRREHAQNNLDKFIKRKEENLRIVSLILQSGIVLTRRTTLMKILTNVLLLNQVWERFKKFKADKLHN